MGDLLDDGTAPARGTAVSGKHNRPRNARRRKERRGLFRARWVDRNELELEASQAAGFLRFLIARLGSYAICQVFGCF
jgi:hypothetical protein